MWRNWNMYVASRDTKYSCHHGNYLVVLQKVKTAFPDDPAISLPEMWPGSTFAPYRITEVPFTRGNTRNNQRTSMYYSSPFMRAWHDHPSWSTATGDLGEPCLTDKGLEEVEWYSEPWSLCDRHCWQSLLTGRKTSRPSPGMLTMMAFPQLTYSRVNF